ncbi:helix-turn-helix domain-containing protein [Candidatus Curtissbacteria bacterium]|nr:helix-turn-helix domain-containing protein [Candidatus Curtissbacteria bacterium]
MTTFSEILSSKRKAKRISLERAARDLLIKKELLEALESANWVKLPEPTIVRGFIQNYASYLGLDAQHTLALYRREFDEKKYPPKTTVFEKPKKLLLTPKRIVNFASALAILIFIIYLVIQYSSILESPKLQVTTPPDDFTTQVSNIVISGQTEKEATVSINGEFAPVDSDGNFSYQLALKDGQNIIEIIAAKRLSPKSKVTKIVRLSH